MLSKVRIGSVTLSYGNLSWLRRLIMTSWHRNALRTTGPLCGEFTGQWRIPNQSTRNSGLWWIVRWRSKSRIPVSKTPWNSRDVTVMQDRETREWGVSNCAKGVCFLEHMPLATWSYTRTVAPKAGITDRDTPQYLWDVITFSCPWYLLVAKQPWYVRQKMHHGK